MKSTFISFLLLNFIFLPTCFTQNVGINSSGSTPDASAILDLQSTDKGILIPRMNFTQLSSVSSPATGLMVYNTDCNVFNFYNGTSWIDMTGSAASACGANKTVFTYTGADQTFNVPSGVTSIDVKIWGAGGTGYIGGAWYGASGGYVSGTVSVTPGDVIKVVVGAGGDAYDNMGSRSGGYSNGGPMGLWVGNGVHYGAGYTGIFTTSVSFANSILIAGGGGLTSPLVGNLSVGGAGGGNTGNGGYTAAASCKTSSSGGGGTQSAGGTHFGTGTSPGQLQGGGAQEAPVYTYGGGGAGYYGGGSGDSSNGICGSWGSGGGSGYIGGSGTHSVSSGVNTTGTDGNNTAPVNPPNTGDSDYVAGVGVGNNSTLNGGDGLIVISW